MTLMDSLVERLGVGKRSLELLIIRAPLMYKVYKIPKRTTGFRVIAQPTKKIKEIQRATIDILSEKLIVHPSAIAYRKNLDIKHNAKMHAENSYLLKMDFEDFFNSITPELFVACLRKDNVFFEEIDLFFLLKILFWNPSKRKHGKLILSIGAPSSPFLSNYVMHFFDEKINKFCSKNKITYSRYADDLTFSTSVKDALFDVPRIVKDILKENNYKNISIKNQKTIFASMAHNRHITGVTINNSGRVSAGRARKRMLSSLIHRSTHNLLDEESLLSLRGQLSQAFYIDPLFKLSMEKKYGKSVVSDILGKKNEKT